MDNHRCLINLFNLWLNNLMRYLAIFLMFSLTSCTLNNFIDDTGQPYEGTFHQCSNFSKVDADILRLNLESLEGKTFDLNVITQILGNPLNKKNIDSTDYYYFGTTGKENVCSVTVPVKNKKIGLISTYGDNHSCQDFSYKSVSEIGEFFWVQTSLQFWMGEGNCGDIAIYRRTL